MSKACQVYWQALFITIKPHLKTADMTSRRDTKYYLILLLVGLGWLSSFVPGLASTSGTVRSITTTSFNRQKPSESGKRKPAVGLSTGKWTYTQTPGGAYTASVTSADVVELAPPFQGGSTVTLTIRKRNGSTTVSLIVSKGQFTSSFQGGRVRIRFDDTPSQPYAFSAAGDGRTDIVFFDAIQPLLANLKSARQTSINVGFYGLGTRQLTFNTTGLRWTE